MQSGDGWSSGSEGERAGLIEPRHAWFPPRSRSLGRDCVAWARDAGWVLFDWQELVIDGMLGLDEDDRWASGNDGMTVSRQNGKGVVLQVIEAFFAFELDYPVVMHTAHEFATSQEHQLRLETMIQNAPHLHARVKDRGGYVHANGQESIRLRSGSRIIFKARTKGGGRGYSGDLLVWDEAMIIPPAVVGAQKPMLRASKAPHGPKVIYAGSAVDQEVHEYGVPFALIRERGIERADKVSYFSWEAPIDSLVEVSDEVLRDRSLWPLANPSMDEGLISPEHMAEEIETMPARTSAVELLGVGDWPRTDGREESAIAIEAWDALLDDGSVLEPPYCLAFDVSPERRCSVALAGRNEEGKFHVEIHHSRPGTGWVVGEIVRMVERLDPEVVLCDGVGPAASLLVPLREAGVDVQTVTVAELGQACGRLIDMVEDAELAHLGSQELRDAVRGARTRPIGDGAFAWGRRPSAVDISPLVAATLALGAAAGVAGAADLVIY